MIDWRSLADLYLRFDVGTHKETGFAEADGLALEIEGRLRLPDDPWLSLVGGLRNEFLDGGNRLTWTIGGFGEWELLRAGGGIDGIYDDRSDTHVGSGFLFISQELPCFCVCVGLWSSFSLWDDMESFSVEPAPGVVQVYRYGVQPYEQTSFFIAKSFGPDCRWDAYVAPGFEHRDGKFQFSAGLQATIVNQLDGFVHYHQTASGNHDWSVFAGLQFHLGCSGSRPFDFMMPVRNRARQVFRATVDTYSF
jgi:hypothetical protein